MTDRDTMRAADEAQMLAEVREQMNSRYKAGTAYAANLAFDKYRTVEIQQMVMGIATPLQFQGAPPHPGTKGVRPRTLDVGCGESGIAAYWPHANTVGLELSEVAVARARERFPDRQFFCGAIETADLSALPGFPFEQVIAVESIEHWTDTKKGLAAIHAALVPHGRFVLTTPNRDSLHVRMGKKLGIAVPYCSSDHIHEFGFQELIEHVEAAGFKHEHSAGIHCAPYWALERVVGDKVRSLTDNDPEVNLWLNRIGSSMPPEFAFIQGHRFYKV